MKKNHCIKAVAALCMCVLASCASQPTRTTVPMSSASAAPSKASLSGSLHAEVNSYRRSHGAKNLQRHPGLDRLAQEHSEYLRKNRGTFSLHGKNVSHYGFEGRALAARQRFQMDDISENVVSAKASGGNPASMLVKLWAGSRNHNHNMRQSWSHTGIGVVVDADGTIFATQLFGTPNNSQMALTDRFRQF